MSGRALALAWLALAAACASPPPSEVTGTVTYRERIALPEGARVRVTLLDVSLVDQPARVIAEEEVLPTGQVPVPFALRFEPQKVEQERRNALHATIADAGGKTLWASPAATPVLTQGAPAAVELVVQRATTPTGARVVAYDCERLSFRVEVSKDRALLFLPGRKLLLEREPTASGAKYAGGGATFWSRGDGAELVLDGVDHAGCRARARPLP
jgi:putative lipoprotein